MICVIAGLIALLQPTQPAPAADHEPCFERLENGLRIGVFEDHSTLLVSVQTWYEAGSAIDEPGSEGLCNLTRSLLENRASAAQRANAPSLRFDSATLPDATYFETVLPRDALNAALQIEAERLKPLTASAAEIANAVATLSHAPQPDSAAAPALTHMLFAGHPYQTRTEFAAAAFDRLAPRQVDEFAARWFVPSNALVLVVGDSKAAETLARMRDLFEALEWKQPPRVRDVPLPQPATTATAAAITRPATASSSAAMAFAWLTPPARDLDNAAIDTLMHRLCNPIDGPLARRLAENGAAPPRWWHYQWRQAGMLVLEGLGSADLQAAVREALEQAATSVPTEIELNRARALVRRDRMRDNAGFAARAWRLGWWEVTGGDLLLADFERAAIDRLPVDELQRAATLLLKTRQVGLAMETGTSTRLTPPCDTRSTAELESLLQSSTLAPAAQCERLELRPGLRVLLKRLPGEEQAMVLTLLTGKQLPAETMTALMAVGSQMHTVDQIRDYLTYHASEIYPSNTGSLPERAAAEPSPQPGLVALGPCDYVPQLIELHAELIRFPQTSDRACQRAAELHPRYQQLHQAAAQAGDAAAYVPDGFISAPGAEIEYPQTANQVADALARLHDIEQVDIMVIGDISRTDLLQAVEAAWPATGQP